MFSPYKVKRAVVNTAKGVIAGYTYYLALGYIMPTLLSKYGAQVEAPEVVSGLTLAFITLGILSYATTAPSSIAFKILLKMLGAAVFYHATGGGRFTIAVSGMIIHADLRPLIYFLVIGIMVTTVIDIIKYLEERTEEKEGI